MTGPEDHDDDPILPEREQLEAWEVPMTSPELTDRIMARLDAMPDDLRPPASSARSGAAWSGAGLSWAVVTVGMVAAAALVLALVRPWATEPPAEPTPTIAVTEPSPAVALPVATLVLRTLPADATVEVDGSPVPGPSPFSLVGLAPGPHRLKVSREGFLPVERTVEGGGTMELPIELPRRDVVLALSVEPPGATVRLWADGEVITIGSDGDRHALQRRVGVRYEIEVTAPGHQARRIPLALTGDADQEVRLSLVPDPEAVSAAPASTRKPGTSTPTKPRTPELEDPFRGRSAAPDPTGELIEPSSSKDEPKAEAEALAVLRIGTSRGDPPAVVYVDGRKVGHTPLMKIQVEPGPHRVEFRFPDGTKTVVRIEVEAGEVRVVKNRD